MALHPREGLQAASVSQREMARVLGFSRLTINFALRRLKLGPHESRAIQTIYVEGPMLEVRVQRQIYTRLREHVFRFESPDEDISAEIHTDAELLVTKYEGFFKRDI